MHEVVEWSEDGDIVRMMHLDHIPNKLIHATHADRLVSILANGLVPNSPRRSENGKSLGVYLCESAEILTMDAMDNLLDDAVILEIDVSSIKNKLKPDPEWRSADHHDPRHHIDDIAWFINETIPSSLIRVLNQ